MVYVSFLSEHMLNTQSVFTWEGRVFFLPSYQCELYKHMLYQTHPQKILDSMEIKYLKLVTTLKEIEGKQINYNTCHEWKKSFYRCSRTYCLQSSGHGSKHPQGLISVFPSLCGFMAEMASSWKNAGKMLSLMMLMVFILGEFCSLFFVSERSQL